MSTTGTLIQRSGVEGRRLLAALAVATVIGAAIGSVVTVAVADDTAPASQVVLSPGAWDPQKLDAMGKRQEAELVIREATEQG
jgi:large-conductance mechanosensitive channel